MPMRLRFSNSGSGAWFRVAAAMTTLALGGCDGGFVPPPPPELRGAVGGSSPSPTSGPVAATPDLLGAATTGVKSIELVLSGGRDLEEVETEKAAARSQAGTDKARLKITVVGEERSDQAPQPTTHKDQATLVRDAIAHHPQALIVEPGDPGDRNLAQAIQEAQTAKVPVVVLGRAISGVATNPGVRPATPTILVAPQPFAASAKQLVAAAIRNARNAKLIPEAGAILLINTGGDAFAPDRVTAIRDALKAAGITAISELRFAKDSQVAEKLLTDRLKADPKPTLVFSVDFASTSASNAAVGNGSPRNGLSSRPGIPMTTTNSAWPASASSRPWAGIYRIAWSARRSRRRSRSRLNKEVRSPVEILIEVHESPPKAGVAHVQARHKAAMKASAGGTE